MSKVNEQITKWIEDISMLKEELGGFSVCPFAKQAKYKIVECNINDIIPIDGYDVIIFVVERNLTSEILKNWSKIYNEEYPEWKFFEDSADIDTYIAKIRTNNGKYNLIIAQPREKLRKYREILSKTNYYDYWSREYLEEVLEEDVKIVDQGIETP